MEKLSFTNKNDFIVGNKHEKYFYKDLELFKKYFPLHRLNSELAKANQFSKERLDAQMIYILLEVVSGKEILENREIALPDNPTKKPKIKRKNIVKKEKKTGKKPEKNASQIQVLKERIRALEESSEINADDIDALRAELDDKDGAIEELEAKIEALETKAIKKKEPGTKNFQP
ncbi:MAG: hypothetical protein LBI65_02105 [Candidatus Symbiothrix sp.]|jgi:predicted RNase H-like nuclease (RuvC/YqgF family)|nr:hypothetical protein [Candidatus Symbiothrix sp.]